MPLPTDLSHPCYHDDDAARAVFESIQWPEGATCPTCGLRDNVSPLGGKSMGPGWYHCQQCREKFTVRVGTVMERSHIPLHKWLLAFRLLNASKKGISAHQLHRMLGIGYRAAWFMAHRIRMAQDENILGGGGSLGGANKVVEIDETYIGGKDENKHAWKREGRRGAKGKIPLVSLMEREGKVRSFRVANVNAATLRPVIKEAVDKASYLMTDDAPVYDVIARDFAGHGSVTHSAEEYVRAGFWHTNTVENYFSIFKRGIVGTYHHVSEAHLHRYAAEFDFRYNNRLARGIDDTERTQKAIKGAAGKRLTYEKVTRI